jgi:hypothetical protein
MCVRNVLQKAKANKNQKGKNLRNIFYCTCLESWDEQPEKFLVPNWSAENYASVSFDYISVATKNVIPDGQ